MTDPYVTRQTLLQRVQNPDDERAWEDFVAYYENFIYMVLRRMCYNHEDHPDLVQDILLKLWEKLKTYDVEKSKFRTWLGTVIRNTFINYLDKKSRRQKREDLISDPSMREMLYAENGDELDLFIHREWELYARTLAMERIKDHFSEKALMVFDRMLDNIPVGQIAEELDLGSSSVYKMGERVKNRLREEIKLIRKELEF
ncbi:sigma-70 family RNA polymerase sigma factor [Lentisphaera profundi]|uniref:Sigma-70 family RNA polymerase sigma factor n=1 Tax=Lentisphaera profundi TaxID=1658616 RepID=A0ABY7VWQ3_9BACT|nr:sigma-70 family RNA polymerase sigma factor [Lentisphaera profundi]WDE96493.1 sigma-70 family RNA polymerase sigma factor [Lentisphaera profundi]